MSLAGVLDKVGVLVPLTTVLPVIGELVVMAILSLVVVIVV